MKKFLFTLATLMLLTSSPTLGELCGSLVAPLYRPGHSPVTQTAAEPAKLTGLPLAAQAQISATLGRDQSSYHAVPRASGFRMENKNHRLAADFTSKGVEVRTGRTSWSLALSGCGYGNELRAAAAVVPQADANRLEYRRGGLTEWYLNGPLGLEQGFTLTQSPGERRSDPLTLAFTLSGNLTVSIDPTGRDAILSRADGTPALRYRGLTSHDATGRELRAWMQVEGEQLWLRVDDRDAQYPLVADPFIQQSKLTASDGAVVDQFGYSLAISGETVVVSAPADDIGANSDQGSAYVFVKPAGGWSGGLTENAKLIASDGALDDQFGFSVAVNGDTIVVGAHFDDIGANVSQGSAYVFVKPAGGWSGTLTENAKLTSSDGATSDFFGRSVAVSGDTIVVGVLSDDIGANSDQGSAHVFVKPAGGWSGTLTQNAKLTASDGAAADQVGSSVAISGDTIVAGALGDDTGANFNHGSAYVFMKPVEGWSGALTQNAKLTSSDGATSDFFGRSVAISADTVVVGTSEDDIGANSDQGSAYVFVKPAGGWSGALTESAKLTASDGAPSDFFGSSVAVSGDTIVAGAFADDTGGSFNHGSAYVFMKPASGWSGTLGENNKLIPSDGAAGDFFGSSVAVSANTIVVGARADDIGGSVGQGSAYVFVGPEADLEVIKAGSPDPVLPGNDLTYTITVTNNGPDDASSVTVTDNLPPEVSFVSCNSTGGGSCSGSVNNRTVTFTSLAAGASETVTLVANVNAGTAHGTIISNTASVASTTFDPNPGNDSVTCTTSVINQADLAVTKTASPATVDTGTNITYTITVANNGPNSAANVTLTDNLPAGTTFVSNSAASGWTCFDPAVGTTGPITCSIASLPNGDTATFTVVVQVSCNVPHATVINNTATVSASTPDPNLSNNSSLASITASNLAPTVTASVAISSLAFMHDPSLLNVGLSVTTSDGACLAPAVSSVQIFGDEDDETPIARDDIFSPDAADIGVGTLRLRAERVKNLDGRVYLIVVKTTDAGGAVGFATTTVVVPKSPSPSSVSSVNAQAAAAKAFADANNGNPPPGYFVIGDGPIIGPLQ
jgi:uncharacterized repeat protein (TIGR01451 family)